MAKYYTNYDLLKGSDGNIYLYLSSKYYSLTKEYGESKARSSLPKGVSAKKIGDLQGKGTIILHALEVYEEMYEEKYGKEPDPAYDFEAWLDWIDEQIKKIEDKRK